MHIRIAIFSENPYALAGFEPGSTFPGAHTIPTAPRSHAPHISYFLKYVHSYALSFLADWEEEAFWFRVSEK
jgi:hypothetical protein